MSPSIAPDTSSYSLAISAYLRKSLLRCGNNRLLIKDVKNTVMFEDFFGPSGEVRKSIETRDEGFWIYAVFCEGIAAHEKWRHNDLSFR